MSKSHLRVIRGRGEEHTTKKINNDPESAPAGRNLKLISNISKTTTARNAVARNRQDLSGKQKKSRDAETQQVGAEDGDSLLAAVSNVSSYVQNISREVHLYVDETAGERRVSVVDSITGKTIRDIPQKELLTISRHIKAHVSDPIKGLIVKSKA